MNPARHVVLFLLGALVLNGCAAAGLAAGPLMSAVQMIGDRSVVRTAPADLGTAVAALEHVLAQSALRVDERKADREAVRLRASGERVTVHAELEPVTARMTRLSLRVETGGLVADRRTGEQLHDQVARVLADAGGESRGGSAVAGELTSLQGEVRRLRSALEERRPAARTSGGGAEEATGGDARQFIVNPAGIVAVPVSYGVQTLPALTAVPSAPAPLPNWTDVLQPAPPDPVEPAAGNPLASRLRPVSPLMPVPSLTGSERSD